MKARISHGYDPFEEIEIDELIEIEGRKAFIKCYDDDPEDDPTYKVIDWDSGCAMSFHQYSKQEAIDNAISFCQKYGREGTEQKAKERIAQYGRANE